MWKLILCCTNKDEPFKSILISRIGKIMGGCLNGQVRRPPSVILESRKDRHKQMPAVQSQEKVE